MRLHLQRQPQPFRDNRFEGCAIGIHFTAGSEGNAIAGNAFIGNRTQVKYVGTRSLDWSAGGAATTGPTTPPSTSMATASPTAAYRPNDIIDRVLWTAPQAKLLMTSPAVQVIRWAQSRFPAAPPGGVVDSAPLMAPPRQSARRDGRHDQADRRSSLDGVTKRYGAIAAVRDVTFGLQQARRSRSSATTAPARPR